MSLSETREQLRAWWPVGLLVGLYVVVTAAGLAATH